MKRIALLLAFLLPLAACKTLPKVTTPAAGSVSVERTTTANDGATTIERITYTTPEAADGAGWFRTGDIDAGFPASRDAVQPPAAKDVWPQRMLYGVGAACLLLGGLFVGIGKHFKLGAISALTGVGIIALAQLMQHYGAQVALVSGLVILSVAAFVGWNLWMDYKDQAEEKRNATNPTAKTV